MGFWDKVGDAAEWVAKDVARSVRSGRPPGLSTYLALEDAAIDYVRAATERQEQTRSSPSTHTPTRLNTYLQSVRAPSGGTPWYMRVLEIVAGAPSREQTLAAAATSPASAPSAGPDPRLLIGIGAVALGALALGSK